MGSLALARVKLLEMVVYALARADKEKKSPQREAELAAYFHLKRLGSKVVGRNWRSGHHPGISISSHGRVRRYALSMSAYALRRRPQRNRLQKDQPATALLH